MATIFSIANVHLDPPSGSYIAPVKVSLFGPDHNSIGLLGQRTSDFSSLAATAADQNSNNFTSPFAPVSPYHHQNNHNSNNKLKHIPSNCWNISIEHIEKIDEVFDGSELRSPTHHLLLQQNQQQKFPSQNSTFIYDGTFRLTRAGKTRVCAWPVGGSYETDRIFAIYYVDNPENAASARGWTVEKAPATTLTHPLTSFVPFSFELSASQRYLARKRQNHLLPGQSFGDSSANTNVEILPAQVVMTWIYDRQVQQEETKRRQQQRMYQQQQMNPQTNFSPSPSGRTPTNYTVSAKRNRSSIPSAFQVASSSLSPSKTPSVSFIHHPDDSSSQPLPHGIQELPRSNNRNRDDGNKNNNEDDDYHHAHHESDDSSIVPRFSAPATIKAEVTTSWEWTKGIRWSYDFGQTAEERYCIRVDRDCGFTKVRGIHGEWDAIVTTEAALPVPVQFDVTPLRAVNTVFGIHDEESVRIGHFQQWKELDCSLHLASASAIGEEPEVMFRFFSHHPRHNLQQQLKTPLFEGAIAVGSTLSMRILPDSNAPGALLLQYADDLTGPDGSTKPTPKFCEVQLFLDGFFLTSAFFPQKSAVRASCLMSDPMTHAAGVQIVPRAPKTHLRVSNVFFGAAPLKTPLEDRRAILQRHITRELEMAKASNYHSDLAHADPSCSVLFVELKIDISEIDSVNNNNHNNSSSVTATTTTAMGMKNFAALTTTTATSSAVAYVPLHLYWRPTWMENLPPWTVKCLGTATQCVMRLFSLESGRGIENFEEAEEKSKQSAVIMQL